VTREVAAVFRDFGFQYEDQARPAVQSINLEIYKGEVFLVVGSSGCGKSSLVLAMNGVIPHLLKGKMTGSVEVLGLDVTKTSASVLARRVGVVFQDPEIQLFATSVEDEVAMSLESMAVPREEMRRRVDWAIAHVGLTGLETRSPMQLSGGQKQWVAIASVLARDVDILILDEPTGNLDPAGSRAVMETVRRICDEGGRTVVLVEKDLAPVVDLVDRVALLDEGRLRYLGSPRELFRRTELLKECGVRIPEATRLALALEERGIVKYPKIPVRPEEVVEPLAGKVTVRQVSSPAAGPAGEENGSASGNGADEVPAVVFDRVTHQFRNGWKGLDDLSCTIRNGEYAAILGQNGAGKSTLVQHIIGIYRPTSGSVRVLGREVSKLTVAELARTVGFIFQNPNHQIFNNTVRQEITFGPRNLGWEPDRIESALREILSMCDLVGFEDRSPEDLSIGEKQRVAVASILIMDPSILILDEPTTGQDERSLRPVMEIVDNLHKSGKTIVMITHDMELAARHAQRVLMLDRGRLVFDGPPDKAFTDFDLLRRMHLEAPEAVRVLAGLSPARPEFVTSYQGVMDRLEMVGGAGA
jgi:energy-coupling factor transport system ATP-binding protein